MHDLKAGVRADSDEASQLRLSRRWTIVWGIVQIGVALGAQGMQRSVLDAGLSVLSWASGPVLGAFLLGTLVPGTTGRQALGGMIAGLAAMTIVWGAALPIAFTWYVFVGSAVTVLAARVLPK